MSQAALNPRQRQPELSEPPQHGSGTRLAGLVFLLAVIASVLVGCWMVVRWMQDPKRLPLSQLVLTGERHYTRDDDIRQAILALGTPGTFMTQDVNIIQQQIERLPWIKQVSVRKQWPDELKIHLMEYEPVARWNGQSLIDNAGNVFSVPVQRMGVQFDQLMQLSGPPESQMLVLKEAREMEQLLMSNDLTLRAAAMTARHSWKLVLGNGLEINTGRKNRTQRLQRFIVLYPVLRQQEQQTDKQISYVDLRYDSGAAVGWKSQEMHHHQQQNEIQAE